MKTNANVTAEHTNIADDQAAALAEAFPDVHPGLEPFGDRVLVQIRRARDYKQLANGKKIYLTKDTQDTEKWNTQVAKVIALGPVCFKNRNTLEPWPERDWCKPGDFVRVPKYGGDRWEVPIEGEEDNPALFAVFKDLDLIGRRVGDPLSMKAFI